MECFFPKAGDFSYLCVLGHIINYIYSFLHNRNVSLTDHLQILLTVGIYKLQPQFAAVMGIWLSADLFKLKEVYAEFVGKHFLCPLYHCRDLGVIITSRKHIEIDDIYGYGLFQLTVILAAFQLRRVQLCPVEKRPVTVIRIIFYLNFHIYKAVVHFKAQVKAAELSRQRFGRQLGICYLYLRYALLGNIKHTRHKGIQHILVFREQLLEYYIQLCGNYISCHGTFPPCLFISYIISLFSPLCKRKKQTDISICLSVSEHFYAVSLSGHSHTQPRLDSLADKGLGEAVFGIVISNVRSYHKMIVEKEIYRHVIGKIGVI